MKGSIHKESVARRFQSVAILPIRPLYRVKSLSIRLPSDAVSFANAKNCAKLGAGTSG